MTLRTCIYARYSSDLQSAASIEDQIRLCREKAAQEDWEVIEHYTDAGISGSSLVRPGIQTLIEAATQGEFDILLCEALDRLSRDLSDIALLFKKMEFAGIKIITLSEGEISALHIGLKGTMNSLYIKDLQEKTRRGMRGKAESGLSAGGLAYGYRVTNAGEKRGLREIDPEEASIVQRIFHEYAMDNRSPKTIAAQLNAEHVPSPSGREWTQSTLNGNRHRGTGILNNPLYEGQQIWNRQRFIKDPVSGKRVPRFNPEKLWIKTQVPELRIINEDLWLAARARQKILDAKGEYLGARKRPQYLLSGLLKCGACGGGFAKINSERYGCAAARNKGHSVCGNVRTIKRELLESSVLDALETRLMNDDLLEVFCAEYALHMNTLLSSQREALSSYKTRQAKLAKEKNNVIQAIKDGVPAAMLKNELDDIARKEKELEELFLACSEEPRPFLYPAMAGRYRTELQKLRLEVTNGSASGQASEHIRMLIEKIVLTPKDANESLCVDLHGDLTGILNVVQDKKTPVNTGFLAANDNRINAESALLAAGPRYQLNLLVTARDITAPSSQVYGGRVHA